MKILFYASPQRDDGEKVRSIIEALVPKQRIETYRTTDTLSRRLRRPIGGLTIALLFTSTKEDFHDLLSLHDLLTDLRILLILPDREADTVSKALSLRPRFFTYADSDFSEVSAVLAKMLKVYGSKSMVEKSDGGA